MPAKKSNSTYLGRHVRLSLGTYDEVLGLKAAGNYNSAQEVIQEAVQALKEKKGKKGLSPSEILGSLGI